LTAWTEAVNLYNTDSDPWPGQELPVTGPRTKAAALTVAGLAVAGAYLWFPHPDLLVVGAFLAGIGTSALVKALRRSPTLRKQDAMVRGLW